MNNPSTSIDVQRLIDEHPFSAFQWLVFGLCLCIVLLDGIDTAAIGYIAPSLTKEWGIAKPALAPVLSAALFGLAAGALTAGPLADRFGRKRVLVGAVAVFALACLASSFSPDLATLTWLRFVTGVGLGAAMPNAVTLTSEYCPRARRALLTNAMFCGFPLGAALGGFLAAWLIPNFGWRSVLVVGGVAPALLLVPLALLLPESVRFLVARGGADARVRALLARVVGAQAAGEASYVVGETATSAARGGVAVVLSAPLRIGSAMLWIAYFMGLVIFYALINWMPLLFKDNGLDPKTATLVAALFPLGSVGAIALGWLMDRFNANRAIAVCYALTAIFIFGIGQAVGNLGALMAFVFVGGALMNTAQSSMPALAAAFYPTAGRATGVSWMLGIGRFGGIAGSFLVAQLTAMQLSFGGIFLVVAVPGLVAACALLAKEIAHPGVGVVTAGAPVAAH